MGQFEATNSDPLVSVVIPNYDAVEFLGDAIDSVRSQSYSPIEIILIDSSGSEDVKKYAKEDDIRYDYQPPSGVAAARNRGIDLAAGEYIAFLDADDWWLSDTVEQRVATLSDTDVVYSDMKIERDGVQEYYESEPFDDHIEFFRTGTEIPLRTVIAQASVFETWRFNEKLSAREDPNLWTKLLSEYEFTYLDEATAVKRIRSGSLTTDATAHSQAMLESYADLTETFPELEQYDDVRLRRVEEHALNLLKSGQRRDARSHALECIQAGRVGLVPITVFGCSLIPRGDALFRRLGQLYAPEMPTQ